MVIFILKKDIRKFPTRQLSNVPIKLYTDMLPVHSSWKADIGLVGVQKLSYNKTGITKLPNELSSYEIDDSFIPSSSLASMQRIFHNPAG